MKKILLLFAALAMFTACDDDGLEIDRVIRDFNIQSSSWTHVNAVDGPYYYCSMPFKELDNFKYDNGNLSVYLERTQPDGVRVQNPLPYVRSLEDGLGQFIRTIDYAYTSSGNIIFYVTLSDFDYTGQPESMRFRAVILY